MNRTPFASKLCQASRAFVALLVLSLTAYAATAAAAPDSGYWWYQDEPGRGFVIEVEGGTMFMSGFLYDAGGRATWVASTGPMINDTLYMGNLVTYTGGQTLTGPYKAPVVAPSLGTVSLTFTSNTTANLLWPGGTIPIRRYDIVPGGAGALQPDANPQAGYWWNASEPGRGFSIEVQNNTMLVAGYMYDSAGNPIWYLSSGAMASPTLYQGNWSQYGNGQALGGSFRAAAQVNGNVGGVTLQFGSPSAAMLTLPDGRQIALARYDFVPPVVAAAGSFPVNVGMANLLSSGFVTQVALSGTYQGLVATGTGTIRTGAAVASSFNGQPALSVQNFLVSTLQAGSYFQSVSAMSTGYFDKNFRPLGQIDDDGTYYVFNGFPGWPAAAKVGDTGQLGSVVIFSDSSRSSATGHADLSYSIQADTADTVIFEQVTARYDTSSNLLTTETDRYRVTRSGSLTLMSTKDIISGTAFLLFSVIPSTLH